MRKKRLWILLILLFLSLVCGISAILREKLTVTQETMNIFVGDISSTKDWQDTTLIYLSRRNELINDILDGKYDNSKQWVSVLKQLECPPLLNGDISLIDYMSKNRGQFTGRVSNIRVEYSVIRQLTKGEVVMNTKISFYEGDTKRNYDYEVVFKNIDGKWLLSKFCFAE